MGEALWPKGLGFRVQGWVQAQLKLEITTNYSE